VTGFDYAVLAVTGFSLLLGLWRGVASELLALVAWVAAYFAARAWGHIAADALGASLSTSFGGLRDPAVRQAIGVVAVFVATLLLFAVARFVLSRLLRAVGLGLVDRFLGAIFGIVRGLLLIVLMVILGGMTSLPMKPWWRDAWLAPPLETAAIAAKPWLPRAVAQAIHYGYR
jgi:membrane protein required for colicin V production